MNANAMAVYTYLRVLADHLDPNLAPLRAKEINFCVSILLNRVSDNSLNKMAKCGLGSVCTKPSYGPILINWELPSNFCCSDNSVLSILEILKLMQLLFKSLAFYIKNNNHCHMTP